MLRLRRNDLFDAIFMAFLLALVWAIFCVFAYSQPGADAPPGYFELTQLESNQADDAALNALRQEFRTAYSAALGRLPASADPQAGNVLTLANLVWVAGTFFHSSGELHLFKEQDAYNAGNLAVADTEGAKVQQLFDAAGHCYGLAQTILDTFGP